MSVYRATDLHPRKPRRTRDGGSRPSAGPDVLVVVEDVVRVVLGLDFGESPIALIAVGLSNPARVVVGIKKVDVDAAGAVRLEGLEEPPRPSGLGRCVLAGLF